MPRFVPLNVDTVVPPEEMRQRAREFNDEIQRRRTVRAFDSRAVPREVIEDCLRAAGSAPSGAHMQPWHFVAVADPTGYPQAGVLVPDLRRKSLEEIATFV